MHCKWLNPDTTARLKILFVLSGNHPGGSDTEGGVKRHLKHPVRQGDSLRNAGHEVDYYHIVGKGLSGYLRNIIPLRKYIREGHFDIVHAHYSLSAIAASLAGRHRMVVSLMGSDVLGNSLTLPLLKLFSRYRWTRVIVKTETMRSMIGKKNVAVLPNGVDTAVFLPINKSEARRQLCLPDKKIVLFAADPARPEKNYNLASASFRIMNRDDALLLPVHDVSRSLMPLYYSAADVLLLTSLWEGSVNTVKEAMACNLAVVSTDVGDVRANTANLEGYHITSFDPAEIAVKLGMALDQQIEIKGRERILELGLDEITVNNRLAELYYSVLSEGSRTAGV